MKSAINPELTLIRLHPVITIAAHASPVASHSHIWANKVTREVKSGYSGRRTTDGAVNIERSTG